MVIVEIAEATCGTLVGATENFCIYRLEPDGALVVSRWREVAIGGIYPAPLAQPLDLARTDRQNARATVLRELLALEPLGLTAAEAHVLRELIRDLTAWPASS